MQPVLLSCIVGRARRSFLARVRSTGLRLGTLGIVTAMAPSSLAAQEGAALHGVVTDSIAHRPLAHAVVIATPSSGIVDTVFHSAFTDAAGRFAIAGLKSGRYSLSVDHPAIDSMGIGTLPVEADVGSGGDVAIALATPSVATLRRTLCTVAVRDTTLGIVLGTVRRSDRTLLAGATVVFSWSDFDIDRSTGAATSRKLMTSVVADSVGVYRACGLPVGLTLLVQAQGSPTQHSGVIEDRISAMGVRIIDFQVADAVLSETAGAPADSSTPLGRFAITGRVETTTAQPIASAQVRLFGTARVATTNELGQFHLAGVPGGTEVVEVLALGYYPQRMRLEIAEEGPPVVVRLERTAAVLDSIRVIAKRVNGRANFGYQEFEQRMARGIGTFIREDEIARRHAFVTADLFKTLPGYSVSTPKLSTDEVILSNRSSAFGGKCALQVFLDGTEIQATDVNLIAPSSIHGIEVYGVSGAPIQYHIRNCGAVFIWTK